MSKAVNDLIQIADILDSAGFSKQAELMDEFIVKVAGPRSVAVQQFIDSLKDVLSKGLFKKESEVSMHQIFDVIDDVAAKGTFLGPAAKIQKSDPDPDLVTAESIAELYSSMLKNKAKLLTEKDPQKVSILESEISEDSGALNKYYVYILGIKSNTDPESIKRLNKIKSSIDSVLGDGTFDSFLEEYKQTFKENEKFKGEEALKLAKIISNKEVEIDFEARDLKELIESKADQKRIDSQKTRVDGLVKNLRMFYDNVLSLKLSDDSFDNKRYNLIAEKLRERVPASKEAADIRKGII